MQEIDCVASREKAVGLLHPLRLEILRLAGESASASELAPKLGLSRQKVNYHVRKLAGQGLLRRAGRRRRRNMVEQRYDTTARAFLLLPQLLGPLSPDWRRIADAATPAYLLALAAQMLSDVARANQSLPVLTFKSQFRFESEAQRDEFTKALRAAVTEVVARHTSAYSRSGGEPYRIVLGCYPYAPQPGPS